MVDQDDKSTSFDALAEHYGRMTDHAGRIRREIELWSRREKRWSPGPVLDVGCGGGATMIALERTGRRTWGIDASPQMLEYARKNGDSAGYKLNLVEGDLLDADEHLASARAPKQYAAIICIGNTLASVLDETGLQKGFHASSKLAAPGAELVIQILNFAPYFAGKRKLINARQAGEWRYTRFAEPIDEHHIRFHVIAQSNEMETLIQSSAWRGWRAQELEGFARHSGWNNVHIHGSLDGLPYDEQSSKDLVLLARAHD